mmetsp:Transcript_37549/g.77059  ORF Transcript_37549/g.77059 Transcript_37549/m.77059 type:complete len:113 (+) Transcript_37549:1004-1342(+)
MYSTKASSTTLPSRLAFRSSSSARPAAGAKSFSCPASASDHDARAQEGVLEALLLIPQQRLVLARITYQSEPSHARQQKGCQFVIGHLTTSSTGSTRLCVVIMFPLKGQAGV